MINARGIVKRFGRAEVLRGVDLSVEKGKVTALLGPSGSGKSVLARCLVGLEPFEAGEVAAGGLSLRPGLGTFAPEAVAMRKRVGIVFPPGAVPPYRTAGELVTEGLVHVRGMSRPLADERCAALVARLGIARCLAKYPRELSTGQLARVALARALSMEPEFLVADEVASNLDPVLAGEVADLLGELAADGIGILAVTHQIEFVRSRADSLYFLAEGKVVEHGRAKASIENPKTREFSDFVRGIQKGT